MFSRRDVIRAFGGLPLGARLKAEPGALDLHYRLLGRTGRWVVPYALGGQASLQWTGPGIDAPDIIVRAVELGMNYLDSANAYGPSQANYGQAFARLHLWPDDPEYNPALRQRLYVATKTGQRWGVEAVRELRTSLTTMFGDGKGYIPEVAYLDAIQIHNLTAMTEIDSIYTGVAERGGKMPARVGALAALLDYRDGTDYSGLNPERKKWIRHIGITGHQSSPVLMEGIRRDQSDIIDTLLVALNPNDRRNASHQFNVLPLARARGLGVIAMKLFADGVFYGKQARFSNNANDVYLGVGKEGAVPPADFVRYPLSLAGVSCAIVGIGRIDRENPGNDQLVSNLVAALTMDPADANERRRIEDDVAAVHGTSTNYFNERRTAVTPPQNVKVQQDGDRVAVQWETALAAGDPIVSYEIYSGETLLRSIPYRPQLSTAPLTAWIPASEATSPSIRVVAVTAARS
jgi:aryl-alcohol dehydrogenase-like predicted oxidoreductase